MGWTLKSDLLMQTRAQASGEPAGPISSGPTGALSLERDWTKMTTFSSLTIHATATFRVSHTWFQHADSQKLTCHPTTPEHGQLRDIDHVLIDGRSSACLEDVRALPELTIPT